MPTPEEVIAREITCAESRPAGDWEYETPMARAIIAVLAVAGYKIEDARLSRLLDQLFHQAPIIDGKVTIEGHILETFKLLADLRYSRAPNAKEAGQPEG